MSKVNLKISLRQLGAVVHSFNHVAKIPLTERNVKVARSCLDKIVIRLKKKYVEEDYKRTLFSPKNKISISMEFHEAHYLEFFLVIVDDYAMSDYDRNVIRFVRSELNQKLT